MQRYPETLNVRLSRPMLRVLETHATYHGVPVSEFVRRCLRDRLEGLPLVEEWGDEEYGELDAEDGRAD